MLVTKLTQYTGWPKSSRNFCSLFHVSYKCRHELIKTGKQITTFIELVLQQVLKITFLFICLFIDPLSKIAPMLAPYFTVISSQARINAAFRASTVLYRLPELSSKMDHTEKSIGFRSTEFGGQMSLL